MPVINIGSAPNLGIPPGAPFNGGQGNFAQLAGKGPATITPVRPPGKFSTIQLQPSEPPTTSVIAHDDVMS